MINLKTYLAILPLLIAMFAGNASSSIDKSYELSQDKFPTKEQIRSKPSPVKYSKAGARRVAKSALLILFGTSHGAAQLEDQKNLRKK